MIRRILHLSLIVILLSTIGAGALVAQAKTPSQAYLEYHDALVKAKTLSEVTPYLSAAYRGMLESRPKEDQPRWLGNLKAGDDVKDLKLGKETMKGDQCTLEATAISARGNAVHGKIVLVKESNAWKIDSTAWAT